MNYNLVIANVWGLGLVLADTAVNATICGVTMAMWLVFHFMDRSR